MPAIITKMSSEDIVTQMMVDPVPFYRDAYKKGMNLSAWFERLDPSEKNDPIDAFGRALKFADIRTRSNPEAGYWASEASEFLRDKATRALMSEFASRVWRKIAHGKANRATFLSGDNPPGSWDRPFFDAQEARVDTQIAPAIPLDELVAITTPITGQDYRAFYMTFDEEAVRLFRIGEADEIPIAKLADSERTINLKKFGRGLKASYEQMRRMRVDKFAMQVSLMAIQSEIDKVTTALDVIISGDGNAGTAATTFNLTTLDTDATAGTLTLAGWLAFRKEFNNPYIITTALMQSDVAIQLELLNMGSANVALIQLQGSDIVGTITPINLTADVVRYGWTDDAPALKIVGIDKRFGLEQVVEIGGDIAETERFITNQTEVLIITEVNGFAILDSTGNLILDINA